MKPETLFAQPKVPLKLSLLLRINVKNELEMRLFLR